MTKIFISYRRDDWAAAQMVCQNLQAEFGNESVFMDTTIPYGADFRRYLNDQIAQCDVLLAIVGNQWNRDQQRLDDPEDFVRIEIEAALQRDDVLIIPVLVGKATMPAASSLPRTMREFAFRQAAEIRSGRASRQDIAWLVSAVKEYVGTRPAKSESVKPDDSGHVRQDSTENGDRNGGDSVRKKSKMGAMRLVTIPAGEFLMGSPATDDAANSDERPQHAVRITQAYRLGVYPVTQHEYERVMNANSSTFKGSERPVDTVTWFDAVTYCNRLSELDGLEPYYSIDGDRVKIENTNGYRLPTEAEWEYACRGGTNRRWAPIQKGTKIKDIAWYNRNSDGQTQNVGQKAPNPWGLHDMHGNVWEWCWSWYAKYPEFCSTTGELSIDPTGPKTGQLRILRGGSFADRARSTRSAARNSYKPDFRYRTVGFRIAHSTK